MTLQKWRDRLPRWLLRSLLPSLKGERAVDFAIAVGLFAGYLAWLIATADTLGYSRDEGFYFSAARAYGKWFEILLSDPSRAIERTLVDQYWKENNEHPALMKSLFWLSHRELAGSVFREAGTAYRFPSMVLAAGLVAALFHCGRSAFGRAGGLVAAAAFALMPRIFYHSHLSCFDVPIAALWFFTAFAYQRSLERPGLGWPLACALCFGLALDTKHNAWILPPAIALHLLVCHVLELSVTRAPRSASRWQRVLRLFRIRVPLAPVLMFFIGPALLYAGWPWIWRDTWGRLETYVRFHAQHVYYNMEFLGRTYFEPPFPRSYAWVMTAATVPAITLALAGIGLCTAALYGAKAWHNRRRALRADEPDASPDPGSQSGAARSVALRSVGFQSAPELWWAIGIAASYGPWLSNETPIFGGTKHWITAYPFLALFAGRGFVWVLSALRTEIPALRRFPKLAAGALGACALLGPLAMTWHSHPWGLSAYTPIVGGAPGGATLGLNRTFWGYTTGALQDFINGTGRTQRVFVHDTAMDSFRMLQKDGRLRRDLKPWWTVSGSTLAIYHHEQHMSRVEHMIWVDYGTVAPAHIGAYDGVPVAWVYQRPR
jgi:4-amino-4-deoxy-L-arabinose transferase-like glycosyltransferase